MPYDPTPGNMLATRVWLENSSRNAALGMKSNDMRLMTSSRPFLKALRMTCKQEKEATEQPGTVELRLSKTNAVLRRVSGDYSADVTWVKE